MPPDTHDAPQPLSVLLPPERMLLDGEADSWEEAVRACGRLLVDTGAVEDRYVDAMLDVVREMGPYIVIAPGIAMPHARPTDGVHHNAFSLVRLRTAVEFGNADNDPVTLLVGLAAVDKDQHVTALRQLVSLIGDRHNVETMRNADGPDEITRLIADVERAGPDEGG
jgi:mannitol/fructose-specific phosphotransferase system IIA component (Ntr-type)